ncbi:MAG: exodeoxyribonuclease VII large subunit [Gemmataceae bacterium]
MTSSSPNAVKALRVSQLNEIANSLLSENLGNIWVEGELSGWKRHESGHYYFALKEGEKAKIDAVMWRSYAVRQQAGMQLASGMQVIALGTVTVYPKTGRYQFDVQRMIPQGVGAAEEALRKLKEKLLKKGYFHPERKRQLPRFPHRIALVTSGGGAAVRDILEIFVRRWPCHDVVIVSVRVQGDLAANEICTALDWLNRLHAGGTPLDAIILGRGGGSVEDLAVFNCESVADAIFDSAIPIVSAVGHEIDFTIADGVADYRATTPTNAAEVCTQHWAAVHQWLDECGEGMKDALVNKITNARRRLDDIGGRRPLRSPLDGIRDRQMRLDEIHERLVAAASRMLVVKKEVAGRAAARLQALSPLNVLRRGYSLTQRESGNVLRDAKDVRIGDSLITRLHRGQIKSIVTDITSPQ